MRIGRTIPLVYGSSGVSPRVAARWWKARVNLNAKAPAFAAVLPELTTTSWPAGARAAT